MDDYDCQSCGACCRAFDNPKAVNYLNLEQSDVERLNHDERIHVTEREIPAYMTFTGSLLCLKLSAPGARCSFLDGDDGKCVSCSIYERRPDVCRELQAGSKACLRARKLMNIEVIE